MEQLNTGNFVGLKMDGPNSQPFILLAKKTNRRQKQKQNQDSGGNIKPKLWSDVGGSAVVYGENGAGKSSFARKLASKERAILAVEINGDNIVEVPISPQAANIHVFDESYVNKNVAAESHMPSIVLLGDQVEYQERIDSVQSRLNEVEARLGDARQKLDKAAAVRKKALEALKAQLRKEGGWVEREESRRGTRVNITGPVQDNFIGALNGGKMEKADVKELREQYHLRTRSFQSATVSGPVDWTAPSLEILPGVRRALDFLSAASPRPNLTEGSLDRRIAEEDYSVLELNQLLEIMVDQERTHCPTCFREWNDSYLDLVREAIHQTIGRMSQSETAREAAAYRVDPIPDLRLPPGDAVSKELRDEAENSLVGLNTALEGLNEAISSKAMRPHVSVQFDQTAIVSERARLERVVERVRNEIDVFNSIVAGAESLEADLAKTSFELAVQEEHDSIELYAESISAEASVQGAYEGLESEAALLSRELSELKVLQSDVRFAEREINRLLRVVFGGNHIALSSEEVGYSIRIDGNQVPASNLSTGEKNIIGLCHFLVSTARDGRYSDSLRSERLVVLDDPISSFDSDNKLGVVALLNYFARQNLGGSSGTRLVILTHDLQIASQFSKLFKAIPENLHYDKQLQGGELVDINFEGVNKYKEYVVQAFQTAFENVDPPIHSNDVRRMFEAFAAFTLDENVSDVLVKKVVTDHLRKFGIDDSSFADEFVTRAFIHLDSHSESSVRMFDYNLQSSMSPGDYRRFVKATLLVMHMVSPLHVVSLVSGKDNRRREISSQLDAEIKALKHTASYFE